MPRSTLVPITPTVLEWAIAESGFSFDELTSKVGAVRAWSRGEAQPSLTELWKLATVLKRPLATFLLPRPPDEPGAPVEFRHPLGENRQSLNPTERRYLREASRQQEILAWLVDQLGTYPPQMPRASLDDSPIAVAAKVRGWLGIGAARIEAASGSKAFRAWRATFEERGVFVFVVPLGANSCRAFSLVHEHAPIIGVNSGWNVEARSFSLAHELGHLVTRSSSACVENPAATMSGKGDPSERWCERFAAALLMPADEVRASLAQLPGWAAGSKVTTLAAAKRIARHFHASLRAAVIRLIELTVADWSLYKQIPASSEVKAGGGRPPDEPRVRARIRQEQFGRRAMSTYLQALGKDILDRSDVVTYLDVTDRDIDQIQSDLLGGA